MNKKRQPILFSIMLLALLLLISTFLKALPASANTISSIVQVVNADGGVYWRSAPDWNTPIRVSRQGVYTNDWVRLECYERGGSVPPYYNNSLWYKASIVSGFGQGTGLVNDHFLNTGNNQPNIPVDGVADCNDTTSSAIPVSSPSSLGASVYYSPFKSDHIAGNQGNHSYDKTVSSEASKTLYKQDWTDQSLWNQFISLGGISTCSPDQAGNFPNVIDNKPVTTLSGWSLGRNGPIYFLRAFPERAKQIHYIVLFDPGSLGELKHGCDHDTVSGILKTWLDNDPNNRLVIMAGKATEDWDSRVVLGGRIYAHQGIQQVYFSQLHDPQYSGKVAVCNYNDMWHEDVWINFQGIVNQPPIENTCPVAPGAGTGPTPWHP